MSKYETEEQQVAALKEWWKENGKAIIAGIVIGLGLLYGWQAWQKSQKTKIAEASLQYTLVLEHLQEKRFADVVSTSEILINDFAKSPYAALASLAKTKAYLSEGAKEDALASAKESVSLALTDDIKSLANVRLAQVQIDAGSYEDAISSLNAINDAKFVPQADMLKGDIYLAQENVEQAKASYKKALDSELSNALRVLTQLKYENLAGKYEPSS